MTGAVKATGGRWDRGVRPLYFVAGGAGGTRGKEFRWPDRVLLAVNEMPTEASEELLADHLAKGRSILLDSGVFWLTNRHKRAHGITMNEALALAPEEIDGFAELEARYVQIVKRYQDRLWGYIELDQGGAENKRRTRARLEALGLAPMPVYHPLNDGWDYFDELASGYDRMCFGNIVQASAAARVRLLHAMFERHRAYPDCWVHILGLTVNPWGLSVPPDSCDSSTWISPLRWLKARTETSMLQRVGTLPPSFTYKVGDPYERGSTWELSFGLCADAAQGTGMGWQHAAARLSELCGGTGPYPPYSDDEPRPCPRPPPLRCGRRRTCPGSTDGRTPPRPASTWRPGTVTCSASPRTWLSATTTGTPSSTTCRT